jgi:hypothetical protein
LTFADALRQERQRRFDIRSIFLIRYTDHETSAWPKVQSRSSSEAVARPAG